MPQEKVFTVPALDIQQFTRLSLEKQFAEMGFPTSHAKTVYRAIYKQGTLAPSQWKNLPLTLTKHLSNIYIARPLQPKTILHSRYDQSTKFLYGLIPEGAIETVLMPEKKRLTLCVSSQLGCAQGCSFCQTGRMGLHRNLRTSEIVGQVLTSNLWLEESADKFTSQGLLCGRKVSNIVFMGMGEPLDNIDELLSAIEIISDPFGLGIPERKISISTAGHLPGLLRLTAERPKSRVSLSVHSASDRKRSRIMPINRRWPIREVLAAIRPWNGKFPKGLLIQYTLISGVNDGDEDAAELCELLSGMSAKINLIPLNPVKGLTMEAPAAERVRRFQELLLHCGFRTMVRYSKGQDIAAACGQLVSSGPATGQKKLSIH